MKTARFFTLVLTTLALFAFTACQTDSSCEILGNCPNETLMDPANPANPFDHIGAQHNQGLAFLEEHYRAEINAKNASSPAEAEAFVYGRSAGFAGSEPDLYPRLRAQFQLDEKALLRDIDFSDYDAVFQAVKLDNQTRQVLGTSLKAIMQMETGSVEATNRIIRAIKDQERIIKATPNLKDRDFALTLLAVMRYSNHYWAQNEDAPKAGRAKWWQIVLADGCCGAIGFALGGPAGGVGLGVAASELVSKIE